MAQAVKKSSKKLSIGGATYRLVGRTSEGLPVIEPKTRPKLYTVRDIKKAMTAALEPRPSRTANSK